MNIHYILQNIPFFTHLTDSEIQNLSRLAQIKSVSKDEKIDIKKIKAFGVVLDGVFEISQKIKGDIFYLAPGSFFGIIPFTTPVYTGTIKAVKKSTILLINPEEITRLLLSSFKGLRGCIRNLRRNGLELSNSGYDFLKQKSKIITVFSANNNSGNTIFSALLGMLLSEYGSTIVLDASYNGKSIFNLFEKDLIPAISQKIEDQTSGDVSINERIVNITENLSLLNISYGSKIKVNPEILSPIIFILSRKFQYIIIDHSDFEKEFTNKILELSDIVLPVLKSVKEKSYTYDIIDSGIKDGQRVYYLLNRFYTKDIGSFEGGYMFENLEIGKKDNTISALKNHIESENKQQIFIELGKHITIERTGIVVQASLINSAFLGGFFSSLFEKDIKIDTIYSSSWSYLIALFYTLSKDQNEFESRYFKFFTGVKIKSFLEITFPEEHIFNNSKIFHFAKEMAGDKRLEHYSLLPVALLSEYERKSKRMFSTGYVRDVFTASFLTDIFEPKKIADGHYHSGYPLNYAKPEDLLRTDIEEIRTISVNNKKKINMGEKKLTKFFKGYIDNLSEIYYDFIFSKQADFSIDIDVDRYNPREILTISKDICMNMNFKLSK